MSRMQRYVVLLAMLVPAVQWRSSAWHVVEVGGSDGGAEKQCRTENMGNVSVYGCVEHQTKLHDFCIYLCVHRSNV